MKKRLFAIKKPALIRLYALLAVAFITCFQLFWLSSVYQNQTQLVQEEARNILKEYVLEYDSMSLAEKIRGSESIIPAEFSKNLVDPSNPNLNIQVKLIGGDNNPLSDSLINKAIDSILAPANSGRLDQQLMSKLKNDLAFSYPDLKYGITYFSKGKKVSQPNPMPAHAQEDVIAVNSQLNPMRLYSLMLFNIQSVVLGKMLWYIVLSFIYLLVCISAVMLLVNSNNKNRKLIEMKDSFTNNMTHEIKTPLSTLYAATEALDKYNMIDDRDAAREYIQLMQADLKRLTGMTESILYNAKLSDGKIYLRKEAVNLLGLLNDTAAKFKPSLKVLNATIIIDAVPGDIFIEADAEHLFNVFSNLVDNSLKYSNGNAVIQFAAMQDKGVIKIQVTDNGIGIAESHYKDIFKPYFRVSEGDKHTVKGYGLGLSYAREIVTLHSGTLKLAKSRLNEGSTFEITLPAANG